MAAGPGGLRRLRAISASGRASGVRRAALWSACLCRRRAQKVGLPARQAQLAAERRPVLPALAPSSSSRPARASAPSRGPGAMEKGESSGRAGGGEDYAQAAQKWSRILQLVLEEDGLDRRWSASRPSCRRWRTGWTRIVEVYLDDVEANLGDEMAERIERNADRYKQLFADAIDSVMPEPTVDIVDEDVADVLMSSRRDAPAEDGLDAGGEAGEPRQTVPGALKRRYEVRLIPRTGDSKSKAPRDPQGEGGHDRPPGDGEGDRDARLGGEAAARARDVHLRPGRLRGVPGGERAVVHAALHVPGARVLQQERPPRAADARLEVHQVPGGEDPGGGERGADGPRPALDDHPPVRRRPRAPTPPPPDPAPAPPSHTRRSHPRSRRARAATASSRASARRATRSPSRASSSPSRTPGGRRSRPASSPTRTSRPRSSLSTRRATCAARRLPAARRRAPPPPPPPLRALTAPLAPRARSGRLPAGQRDGRADRRDGRRGRHVLEARALDRPRDLRPRGREEGAAPPPRRRRDARDARRDEDPRRHQRLPDGRPRRHAAALAAPRPPPLLLPPPRLTAPPPPPRRSRQVAAAQLSEHIARAPRRTPPARARRASG